jgi:hypothetical protein
MELLATVHWAETREEVGTVDEVIAATYAWSPRKRMFSESHIRMAWEALQRRGWIIPT